MGGNLYSFGNPGIASGTCVKIASKTAIDGSVQAATNLTWEPNISLATHMPLYMITKFNSGVLGIGVIRLLADTIPVTASIALLTVITGTVALMPIIASLAILSDSSKFLKVDITTASLAASTFNVTVYGVPY